MAQRQPTRNQMLSWINMVSFAVVEAGLYLDTHPADPAALSYYREYSRLRKQAVDDYTSLYGPLTSDAVSAGQERWQWIEQPWPWEGGAC